MALTVKHVTPHFQAVQYTGANGAEIVSFFAEGNLINDDGTSLIFEFRPQVGGFMQTIMITAAQWLVWRIKGALTEVAGNFSDATFQAYWKPVVELLEPTDRARMSYFGSGVGTRTTALGIGATGTVDTRLTPPIPAALAEGVQIKSDILGSTGINLGTVSVTATPVVVTALVPAATVSGVLIPAHSLVRTTINNAGLSILSSVQVFTTAHY